MSDPWNEAMTFLKETLKAERALVVMKSAQGPEVVASHNFDSSQIWLSAPISLTVLRRCLETGEPLLSSEVSHDPRLKSLWSLRVAEVRSLLCVPWWNSEGQVAGLLYADQRAGKRSFSKKDMDSLQLQARRLEKSVEGRLDSHKMAGTRLDLSSPPQTLFRKPTATTGNPIQPRSRSLAIFFRSLEAMLNAGIPIAEALFLMGKGDQDDEKMAAVCRGLEKRLRAGKKLSEGMRDYPGAFTVSQVALINAAEESGTIHRVLGNLADFEEHSGRQWQRLQAALTYPALVLCLCLALLVFGLPFLLQGQFQLITQAGVEPPWLTRLAMALGQTFPFVGIAIGALLLWRPRLPWRRWGQRVAPVAHILRLFSQARFCRTLAIQLSAGQGVLQAIPLAFAACGDRDLEKFSPQVVERLTAGDSLSAALQECRSFSRILVGCLQAGETVGHVEKVLHWVSEFNEQELDYALTTWMDLVEPLLVLVMGGIVGLMMLATMLPMVKVLQTL